MQKFIDINDLSFEENDRYLVITNAYPHPRQLYRNGFIHRRVKAYIENGLKVDIFVIHSITYITFHYITKHASFYFSHLSYPIILFSFY